MYYRLWLGLWYSNTRSNGMVMRVAGDVWSSEGTDGERDRGYKQSFSDEHDSERACLVICEVGGSNRVEER